jgi:hypothetical protein
MGTNERLVNSAPMKDIMDEYRLILDKKSKQRKAVRDKVVARAEKHLGKTNK